MKNTILITLICSLFVSCKGQTNSAFQTIDVKTFAEKLKSVENPQLIDVRTPEEFATEKIENAVNVNWNGENFEAQCNKLDKTKPVFVYCKVGGRSAKAATKLAEMGFTTIYNLDGGIMKWNANPDVSKSNSNDKIVEISKQEFLNSIKNEPKVIVSFYAKWCEPCHKMQPYIIKMQDELKDKIKIVRLDADQNKSLLEALKLDGLPVILIYENGKETFRKIGLMSEDELRKHI